MGVVVGAPPVSVVVGQLGVRSRRVGSEKVLAWLHMDAVLLGLDVVAQSVEEEQGPAPGNVMSPLAVEVPLEHTPRPWQGHVVVLNMLPRDI